jgi:hypothetical protein
MIKIKSGFVVREIAGQSVVVALGAASKSFNGIIKLNETGRVMWDMLAQGTEKDDVVNKILSEYDVDRATVEKDFDSFVTTLKENNILE